MGTREGIFPFAAQNVAVTTRGWREDVRVRRKRVLRLDRGAATDARHAEIHASSSAGPQRPGVRSTIQKLVRWDGCHLRERQWGARPPIIVFSSRIRVDSRQICYIYDQRSVERTG